MVFPVVPRSKKAELCDYRTNQDDLTVKSTFAPQLSGFDGGQKKKTIV